MSETRACIRCGGKGWLMEGTRRVKICPDCGGTGRVWEPDALRDGECPDCEKREACTAPVLADEPEPVTYCGIPVVADPNMPLAYGLVGIQAPVLKDEHPERWESIIPQRGQHGDEPPYDPGNPPVEPGRVFAFKDEPPW